MAEHFPDSTKKMDFIRREQMHKANRDEWQGVYGFVDCDIFEDNEDMIDRVPAADVVARDCYDRVLAENDTMRKQLAQIGKKTGDKMDDVRQVVRGKWEIDNSYAGPGLMNLRCSVCGEFGGTWRDCTLPSMLYKFCPNCGADMREPNLDTTKGDDHD